MIELIAAASRNGVIGADNRLLWRIPEDFAHFKRTTMGAPVVMGRRTWESIGRALPGRLNIVISRRAPVLPEGVLAARSLEEALALAAGSPRIFVIGGGEIYRQAMPFADRIWLTRIDADFEGDAYFPTIPRGRFIGRTFRTLLPTVKRPWRVDFQVWTPRR
ncbi:dihydrofolate reductase [Sutterella sp.]|uniref:dihydrofolate reductase n=1 Tax=Sutterella sp. TaxID=1981025 RepID=UPI0025CC7C8E|nr:dihydrofolate reductase [uncultured Sutterella sp.]